jgi:hypothetical protein
MARTEQYTENGKFITVRKHPFWNGIFWLFAIGMVCEGIAQTPLLIIPTVILLGMVIQHRAKQGEPKKP